MQACPRSTSDELIFGTASPRTAERIKAIRKYLLGSQIMAIAPVYKLGGLISACQGSKGSPPQFAGTEMGIANI